MKRLVSIDLPRRLSRRLPRPLTEAGVGLALAAGFALLRGVLDPWLDDLAYFPLSMLGIMLAVLLAGWRSGLVALVAGQLLLWYFVLPPKGSFAIEAPAIGWGLLLSTLTEAVMLFALALYQRQVRAGELERARRINFLGHALREIDHRTKNNFQIVTSLLLLQANKSSEPAVKGALNEAAERLKAVAAVYDALAPSSQGLAAVRLQDQLEEMCAQIRRGILPEGIELTTELEPMLVPHETAVAVGIVVNELVTNACKHAFPDHRGAIVVRARKDGAAARIEVADNGAGMPAQQAGRNGLGTRLIAVFVQRLKAKSEIRSSAEGTVHAVLVPLG